MMNNKITRIIANTVGLAAVAALGITVYQLGTAPVKENAPKEQTESTGQEEDSMVDVGNSQVESENQPLIQEEGEENQDYTQDTENTVENLLEDSEADEDNSGEDANSDEEDVSSGEETLQTTENEDAGEATDVSASAVNLPAVNFSEDTLMEWPVNGNILLDYSMDQTTYFPTLDQYKLSPGISVGAVEGAPVTAAVNGTVYSIEQDAQTGTTLTMELGNGYQAVYGQLEDLTVSEGDTVKKGTTIGYIAQPTKYYSTEGTNLYFAMKRNGEPVDPIQYLP